MITLARAAALQAESQPSMSKMGSASATPEGAGQFLDAFLQSESSAHGGEDHLAWWK
ncbi:MAG: hypothetical protein QM757_16955 [Paludibaculum sp.]